MEEVQRRVDVAKEKALKVKRDEKKAQVILFEVGVETWCYKEVLKEVKVKLTSAEERTNAAEERATKVEAMIVEWSPRQWKTFQSRTSQPMRRPTMQLRPTILHSRTIELRQQSIIQNLTSVSWMWKSANNLPTLLVKVLRAFCAKDLEVTIKEVEAQSKDFVASPDAQTWPFLLSFYLL